MFPYTEKDTESEHDIQNNNLLNKIDQTCQHTFEIVESFEFSKQITNQYFISYLYKLHNS